MVMKSAENGRGYDAARVLDGAMDWSPNDRVWHEADFQNGGVLGVGSSGRQSESEETAARFWKPLSRQPTPRGLNEERR
jgi:hypothetical protein